MCTCAFAASHQFYEMFNIRDQLQRTLSNLWHLQDFATNTRELQHHSDFNRFMSSVLEDIERDVTEGMHTISVIQDEEYVRLSSPHPWSSPSLFHPPTHSLTHKRICFSHLLPSGHDRVRWIRKNARHLFAKQTLTFTLQLRMQSFGALLQRNFLFASSKMNFSRLRQALFHTLFARVRHAKSFPRE
jgi:hypothetical protein